MLMILVWSFIFSIVGAFCGLLGGVGVVALVHSQKENFDSVFIVLAWAMAFGVGAGLVPLIIGGVTFLIFLTPFPIPSLGFYIVGFILGGIAARIGWRTMISELTKLEQQELDE